ncbi:DUF3823 domain-containing protein [Sphingobacterium chuzhouense]|uniref:DUF3823 domain-containing protein n=1 Tax=Sphingobacterium chuzhouense TaxID=1742264 RepID=A0ABR7XTS6_9SPHI|nr:DUF3823 domain-containing protein [Sphingobacterium chuzhouense]MBD1422541.1 DUF3823 domain-containing protein [Sphingobacterium chuzhouense]
MKIKASILIILIVTTCIFTGCEYDNFTEPTSTLTGRVVYNGEPVGVRTNGPQLELWEDGHELRAQFPIHVTHDGTFSAVLFDGEYKLVRKTNSPWLPQLTDTIIINVNGHTAVDVPVEPYFTLSNISFQHNNGEITANFFLNKIIETANLDNVNLYLGKNLLIDDVRHDLKTTLSTDNITIDGSNNMVVEIPANLRSLGYIFVRIGVKASASGELYYSQVQKVNL